MNPKTPLPATLRDKLRASPLLVLFAVAFAITAFLNPAKVGLTVWGIAKLGTGGYVGYRIDRLIFPYARPRNLVGIEAGTSWKRRAAIVSATILAAAFMP